MMHDPDTESFPMNTQGREWIYRRLHIGEEHPLARNASPRPDFITKVQRKEEARKPAPFWTDLKERKGQWFSDGSPPCFGRWFD